MVSLAHTQKNKNKAKAYDIVIEGRKKGEQVN